MKNEGKTSIQRCFVDSSILGQIPFSTRWCINASIISTWVGNIAVRIRFSEHSFFRGFSWKILNSSYSRQIIDKFLLISQRQYFNPSIWLNWLSFSSSDRFNWVGLIGLNSRNCNVFAFSIHSYFSNVKIKLLNKI